MLKHEGGEGMTEPTTGNEIPLGSNAEEVADDIPAKLSEGEFVIPADVVRWFGVDKFYKMIEVAKQGFAAREAEGQMDSEGPELELMDEDFEFEDVPEDYEPVDEVEMATGGLVVGGGPIDPQTGLRVGEQPTSDTGMGGTQDGVGFDNPDVGSAADLGDAIGGTTDPSTEPSDDDQSSSMADQIGGISVEGALGNMATGPGIFGKAAMAVAQAAITGRTSPSIPGLMSAFSGFGAAPTSTNSTDMADVSSKGNEVTDVATAAVENNAFSDMASVDTPDAPANDPDDGEAEGGQDGNSGSDDGGDGGDEGNGAGDDADGMAKGGFVKKRKSKKYKSKKGFMARK